MDHTRDNPLKRFAAFWIAALLIASFAIACVILRPMTHRDVTTVYDMKAEARLELVSEARAAQGAALNTAALEKAIAEPSDNLSKQVPTPGSKPLVAPAPAETPKEDEKPAPAE